MQLQRALAYVLLLALPTLVGAQTPTIGLITKTETNPFFVMMKKGAESAAKANGARLLSGAGKSDGDNAGQVAAIENMIAAGAKVIMITPSDAKAILTSAVAADKQIETLVNQWWPPAPAGADD